MSNSGNPAKQERPDGREQSDQVTKAFPPNLSAVVTAVGAEVVPFAFPGGKAIDLTVWSGDLQLHLHLPPVNVETVIETLRQAKIKADTGIEVAKAMPNGNGGQS